MAAAALMTALPTAPAIAISEGEVDKTEKVKKTDDKGPETNDDNGTVPHPDKREKTDEVPTCEQEEPVSEKPAAALPTDPAIAIPKVETNDKVEKKDNKGALTNADKGPVPGLDKRKKTDEVLACDQEDPVLKNPAAALPTTLAIAISEAHKVEANDKICCLTQHSPQVTCGKIRTRSDKLVSTLNGDAWQKSPKHVYELDCPACSERGLQSIFFYDAVEDEHGIFCCVACSNIVGRIVERQGIKSKSGWKKWDKKEYREYPRSQWDVSMSRTFTLLDKVSEEQPCPKTQTIGKPNAKTKAKRKMKPQFKPKVKSKSPESPQKTMIMPIHDLTVSDDEEPSLPSADIPGKKSQPAQKKRKAPSYHQHNKRQKTSIDPRSVSEENKPAVPAAAVVAVKGAVELIVRCLNSYMGTNLQVTERSDA